MTHNLKLQNNLERLLSIMPPKIMSNLSIEGLADVIEIVLDIGRIPEIRYSGGTIKKLGDEHCNLVDKVDTLTRIYT